MSKTRKTTRDEKIVKPGVYEVPAAPQEPVPTIYVYRQPDGSTQVMAPDINDRDLVIDMLEEGIRAMSEGRPITRN